MDQVTSAHLRAEDRLERIRAALSEGFVLVNAEGEIVWADEITRRRFNGELNEILLPAETSDAVADCSISTAQLTINGRPSQICVIREAGEEKQSERDLVAAINAVMADTSWFTRTIIDKLKAWRMQKDPGEAGSSENDMDILSGREREVLGLICEGRGDAEMSQILRLSPNTVRNHIMSLYRKIGVNRRSGAIIWARERGITCTDLADAKRARRSARRPSTRRSSDGRSSDEHSSA